MSAPDRPPAKLDGLDGLRGVAIVLVILFHIYGDGRGYHPLVVAALEPFRLGYTGVDLFLVLSGFCLTHSLIRRAAAGRPQPLGSYFKARWWRIAPPYYAAMVVYLAFPALSLLVGRPSPAAGELTVRQIGTHLLFAHGFFADTIDAICTAFWSLSLEFQFYLALPLLVPLSWRFGAWRVLAAVAVSSLLWRWVVAVYLPDRAHLINGLFLGRWTEFALGLVVAFWFNDPGRDRSLRGRELWRPVLALGLLGGCAALSYVHANLLDFGFGAGYASLLAAMLRATENGRPLARWLSWRPLAWVGTVSYSLYLTHSLFVARSLQVYRQVVRHPDLATDAMFVVATAAVSVAGGWVFYRLVEAHFIRSVDASRFPRAETAPETAAAPVVAGAVQP